VTSPEKHAVALKLFATIGGQKMVEDTLRGGLESAKAVMGDAGEIFDELEKMIVGDTTVSDAWIDALERALETEELESLIEFYEAPHGKKMAASLPRLGALVGGGLLRWQTEVLTPLLTKLIEG
jgi:hypothetical protein